MTRLSGFAEACYDQNSVEQLEEALRMRAADKTDCAEWRITPTEWRAAIAEALAAKRADAAEACDLGTLPSIERMLASAAPIHIISGEGDDGGREVYTGKRTILAIKRRLTRERCGGQRWAWAQIYAYEAVGGAVGIDPIDGEIGWWREAE